MKYTIPYDDKITLPHIKKIESVGISADNLLYDRKELSGEVIITGEYSLDNSEDIMEFKHDIPVSLLIDDARIDPQINISNFKYELISGRGIEVIFDLDVILEEEEENEEETPAQDEVIRDDEEEEEKIRDEDEDVDDEEVSLNDIENKEINDIKDFQEQIDKNLDEVLNTDSREDIEDVNDEIKNVEEKVDDTFNTKLEATLSSFDTSFVPRDNDKFTTYKILLVEKDETIDQLLEERNLSKTLICKEYQFDEQKIVLKLEDD